MVARIILVSDAGKTAVIDLVKKEVLEGTGSKGSLTLKETVDILRPLLEDLIAKQS